VPAHDVSDPATGIIGSLIASPQGDFIAAGSNYYSYLDGSYAGHFSLYDNSGNSLGGGLVASDAKPSGHPSRQRGIFQVSWQDASEGRCYAGRSRSTRATRPISPHRPRPSLTAFDDVPPVTGVITGPTGRHDADDPSARKRGGRDCHQRADSRHHLVSDRFARTSPKATRDITLSLSNGSHTISVSCGKTRMASSVVARPLSLTINTALTASATRTDFNGDLDADILWQSGDGQPAIWADEWTYQGLGRFGWTQSGFLLGG